MVFCAAMVHSSPRTSARQIPTVPGLPLLGSAYEWWRRPLSLFIDAYIKYGPVFRLEFPAMPAVTVIAGPASRCPLQADPVKDMHREEHFDPFIHEVGLDVFALQGERHVKARNALKLPYSRELASQFAPKIQAAVRECVADWVPGERLELFEQCAHITTRAMMTMITPIDLGDAEPVLNRAGDDVMHALFRIRPRIILKNPAYLKARNRLYAFIDEAVQRHKQGEFADQELTYMIDACLQSAGNRLTEKDIRGICLYALAGTRIYTGRLVAFMVLELLRHRTFLDTVRRELDQGFLERPMDASMFRRMPHLRAAYLETLRFYPLIPGCPYWTERDTELLGYAIPKGSYMLFAPYLAHFSEEFFPNALSFDPNRGLPGKRECFNKPGAFAPFGAGSHACVAGGMVEVVALSIVSELLGEVELSLEFPSRQIELGLSPLITPRAPVHVRAGGRRTRGKAEASALSPAPDFDSPLDLPSDVSALPHPKLAV